MLIHSTENGGSLYAAAITKKNEELGGNIPTSKKVTSVPSEQMYIHKDNISVQSLAVHHFCREGDAAEGSPRAGRHLWVRCREKITR